MEDIIALDPSEYTLRGFQEQARCCWARTELS
jgi:hypothetical protein